MPSKFIPVTKMSWVRCWQQNKKRRRAAASLHSQVSDRDWRPGYMFAHLQVHMQMENHYSSAHKGATYKGVHIYGIFQQRSNSSSDSRHRTGCRSRHLGSHQPAGRLRQRQPRCQCSYAVKKQKQTDSNHCYSEAISMSRTRPTAL